MKKQWFVILGLGAALLFAGPGAMAGSAKGQGNGKSKDKQHGNADKQKSDKHKGGDDHGWDRRDGYEYRTYADRSQLPAGWWDRGKKVGWSQCGMPPGQAKKYGCRSYVYQGRTHYFYEDDGGRIIVRRPTIAIHGSVDIVR